MSQPIGDHKILRIIIPILLLASLLLAGCAQKDSAVGSDLAPGLNNIYPQELLLNPQHSAFYQAQSTTGSSPFLYLGFTQGYEAQALVQFIPTNTMPDSFFVDTMIVKLYLDSVIVTAPDPLQISAISLNSDQIWGEIGVIWDTLNSWQLGDPLTSFPAPLQPGDSVAFELPAADSLLRSWRAAMNGTDSLAYNNGFYLRADAALENLIRLGSGENVATTRRPKLEMHFTAYDSTDSGFVPTDQIVSLYATNDAFIARDQAQLDTASLYIGNAASYRSNLIYDLEGLLPTYGTAVQRAEVVLHADTTNPANLGAISGGFTLAMVDTSWYVNPATAPIQFGSTPFVGAYNSSNATLTLNLTEMVYNWVQEPSTNSGFLIQSSAEFYDLSRTVFYGINAPDSLRPKLRIVYLENQP